MKDLITVVVPFYCTPKDLFRRCLESILVEGVSNIEVLVVDDGSPEPHQETLREVTNDSRVRVIYAPHAGVSAARNRGIREAKGKWITFVDSDDYFNSEIFKRIADEVSAFSGDVEIFNGGQDKYGNISVSKTFLRENHNYAADFSDKISIMESALSVGILPKGCIHYFSYGAPYCKLFRRDFLVNNNLYFDESVKLAEDALFSLYMYQHAQSIYYHDWFLYHYVEYTGSVTRKYRPGFSDDMDIFFARVKAFIEKYHLEEELGKGYLLRAEFEVCRCFEREFFNPQNTDPKAQEKYNAFIQKEPYREALKARCLPVGNIRQGIYRFLIRHGLGGVYVNVKKIKGMLKRRPVNQ